MARWEPNARERLQEAAMELFRERGYDRTTVTEIAARAGLTERTFFRHFADKREVLFAGSEALEKILSDAIVNAPFDAAPFDAVASAVEAAGAKIQAIRDYEYARARYALLAAHAELRERELIKFATLASAVALALRERGVADPAASLCAEAGLAVFKVGYDGWVSDPRTRDLPQHIRAAVEALRAVTAATATSATKKPRPSANNAPARAPATRARRGAS